MQFLRDACKLVNWVVRSVAERLICSDADMWRDICSVRSCCGNICGRAGPRSKLLSRLPPSQRMCCRRRWPMTWMTSLRHWRVPLLCTRCLCLHHPLSASPSRTSSSSSSSSSNLLVRCTLSTVLLVAMYRLECRRYRFNQKINQISIKFNSSE